MNLSDPQPGRNLDRCVAIALGNARVGDDPPFSTDVIMRETTEHLRSMGEVFIVTRLDGWHAEFVGRQRWQHIIAHVLGHTLPHAIALLVLAVQAKKR
jgi:hypothetical protein